MKHLYKIRLIIAILIFAAAAAGSIGLFYPIKIFDFQFAAVLQKIIVNVSVVTILYFIITLLLTVIFGRIYCSLFCPLGILQETIHILTRKKFKSSNKFQIKYILAIPILCMLISGNAYLLKYIEPYTIFVSAVSLAKTGLILMSLIIITAFIKGRFFCTNICPTGTILGIISKFSIFRIHIDKENCISCGNCERNCQAECINPKEKTVDNENCIKCLKCLNLCPKNAIKIERKKEKIVKFNNKRRTFLIAGIAAIATYAAMKVNIAAIETAKKIKNRILPPGAKNTEEFISKCFNCNLCVQQCPEKIIKKANTDFDAPHVEYDKNKQCKYDCNKCGNVCPTGAIKRIPLEEKQKTQIATATINKEKCINCGLCNLKCPRKTVVKKENSFEINENNCIGCGVCKSVCPANAIEIFAVKEQKII